MGETDFCTAQNNIYTLAHTLTHTHGLWIALNDTRTHTYAKLQVGDTNTIKIIQQTSIRAIAYLTTLEKQLHGSITEVRPNIRHYVTGT